MGYNLTITREQYSPEKCAWVRTKPTIALEEWLAVIESDPELTFDELNKKTAPYMVYWSGPGKYPCWLDYSDGRLYTKNPTEEMTDKMVQIAKDLGASVVGEEGEEYLGDRWVATIEQTGRSIHRLAKRTIF